jgi:arsenite methyltransferase
MKMDKDETRKAVREGYAKVVTEDSGCCTPVKSCCCGTKDRKTEVSESMGYNAEELAALPEGANLGLGCGNPVAFASLKEGETFLDLGSGAGIDCFLAAAKVGPGGKAIGVDMTPEMLEKARKNAEKGGFTNVEFRLGEIEHLPVADGQVDIITSNCVINLSPDKPSVFAEAFRVLKPGGRVMISDIVLLKPLPDALRDSLEAYVGCVSGAMLKDDYLGLVKEAGFTGVSIMQEDVFPVEAWMDAWAEDRSMNSVLDKLGMTQEDVLGFKDAVVSLKFSAKKPAD